MPATKNLCAQLPIDLHQKISEAREQAGLTTAQYITNLITEYFKMKANVIIGVDHGYAAMKSVHFSFPTGLVEYEHEPYTRKDVLELDGRYYVVGTGRQPLQKDKTATEDYYLLTLAAIAKELEHRQASPAATVHLAAGLPLTSFGRDKKKFKEYLFRDGQPVTLRSFGVCPTTVRPLTPARAASPLSG